MKMNRLHVLIRYPVLIIHLWPKVVCLNIKWRKAQEIQHWPAHGYRVLLHCFIPNDEYPVCLLVWCCANSLASTIVVLSPGYSSSLPVLMRAAGHRGVFLFFLRQTMQFKPALGMYIYSLAGWLKINGNCFRRIIINILLWMPFCRLGSAVSSVSFSR